MSYWGLFLKVIILHPLRSGHALLWLAMGKKKRARNRFGLLVTNVQHRYDVWIRQNEDLSEGAKLKAIEHIKSYATLPRFMVIICGSANEGLRAETTASLRDQWYDNWVLATAVSDNLEGTYVCWVNAGDRLSPNALFEMAQGIVSADEDPIILYADEDQVDDAGKRRFPHFKPEWNFELLLSQDYVGGLCALQYSKLSGLPEATWEGRYKSLLSLGHDCDSADVLHIPKVLFHRHVDLRRGTDVWLLEYDEITARKRSLNAYIKERGITATVALDRFDQPYVNYGCDSHPLVSLIIPTRDFLHLLTACVDSILAKTTYPNFEIVIVDNDSALPETLTYFKEIVKDARIKVMPYPGIFNYSAINNFAVDHAAGDYIALVNNDTEVINDDWLSVLMAQAMRSGVGAVGAKLLYGDGRIQHAGVTTGLGQLAGHSHRFLGDVEAGYFYRAHLSQYVSVVTAACLVVEKAKYLEVGGLDADNLVVAFNDVDLCLKLDEAGYDNIYTPHARLYHHESVSRGKDMKGEKRTRYLREVEYMQNRWHTDTQIDRYYSPNLTTDREDFAIKVDLFKIDEE